MTGENEDVNSQWSHAVPLEETFAKRNSQAELSYLRDLFNTRLPVIDKTDKANEYFDFLQHCIDNATPIERETFEHDYPVDDRGQPVYGEDGNPIIPEYRYISASLFKELASRPKRGPGDQDLDRAPIDSGSRDSALSKSPELDHVAPLPISPKSPVPSPRSTGSSDTDYFCG